MRPEIRAQMYQDRKDTAYSLRSEKFCKLCEKYTTCRIPFKKDCPKIGADMVKNFQKYNNWDNTSKKNRLMFNRLATGLRIANYRNEKMRFLTLTSSKEPRWYRTRNGEEKQRTIKQSWTILRMRIKRVFGWNLNKYICFRTSEGNGVMHIIYWGGKYLTQDWISKQWQQIHNASITFIELVRKNTVNGLVGYLLDRYLLNQPIERMSYGWGWAWLGFCKSWKNFKETYNNMRSARPGDYTEVIQQCGYVPFKLKRSYHAVDGWKKILYNERKTSRQTRFQSKSGEWNFKLGNLTFA